VAGGDLAGDKRAAADLGAWLCFEDESGQGLRPPKGRTWGRRGRTPVVTVTAQGSKRVSVAALIAARPGTAGRARLIYRTHLDRGSGRHRRKGFTETGYARLLDAAHQQLHGHIVLIWDNLPTHVSRAMRQLIAARSWLTVFQLPAYAPELNPVEIGLPQCELRRSPVPWLPGSLSFVVLIGAPSPVQRRRL
jgi:DDE superfamily endonuclease